MAYHKLQIFHQLRPRRALSTAVVRDFRVRVATGLVLLALLATALANLLPTFGRAAVAARIGPPGAAESRLPESVATLAVATQVSADLPEPGAPPPGPPALPTDLTVPRTGLAIPPGGEAGLDTGPEPGPGLAPEDPLPSFPPNVVQPDTPPLESRAPGTAAIPAPAEDDHPPEPPEAPPDRAITAARELLLEAPARPGQPVRIPILMYHHIGGLPAQPDRLRLNLTLSVAHFTAHLAYFRDNGYQTVTLNDVVAAMYGEADLPEKPIVLTFDDGYLDHYTNAFPLLQESGFTATFFIVTSLVGDGEYVTWEQLREMAAAGMRIEAHGLTHRDLREIGSGGIRHEAVQARQTLEEEIGQPVRFYCYPAGKYTDQTPALMAEAGYLGAVTVQHGLIASPGARYELPRVRIHRGDSPWAVAARLR